MSTAILPTNSRSLREMGRIKNELGISPEEVSDNEFLEGISKEIHVQEILEREYLDHVFDNLRGGSLGYGEWLTREYLS